MPLPTLETLQRIGAKTGYAPNTLEKVARMLDMLDAINKDPSLSGKLALKGGTALNVFHLEPDRLSVDIDFNYIGARDKQEMQEDRPALANAIVSLINSRGCTVRHRPRGHGGGKWISRYASVLGGNASMEIDLNFMQRQPLFGASRMDSAAFGGIGARDILLLDLHEVVAEKLIALVSRNAVRDLYDARRILSIQGLDWRRVKTAFLALGACGRFDWRNASVRCIDAPTDSSTKLLYCLPAGHSLKNTDFATWVQDTVTLCRERFDSLFALSASGRAFLDALLDRGEINTSLLEEVDSETQARIAAMPMLAWKAHHVRNHRDGNTTSGKRTIQL